MGKQYLNIDRKQYEEMYVYISIFIVVLFLVINWLTGKMLKRAG